MATCEISTLTPIHIGTGETYSEYDFVYAEGKKSRKKFLVRIDMERLFRSLDDAQRKRFADKLQTGGRFTLDAFFREEKITHLLRTTERYGSLLPKSYNQSERHEIRECIKTADVPYIPGSGIKGSVRTALLWKYASENTDEILSQLERELGNRTKKKFVLKKYADNLFVYRDGNSPALYDIMKFLLISDFMPEDTKSLFIKEIRTWSLKYGVMEKKRFVTFAECIGEGRSFTGSVDVSPQYHALPEGDKHNVRETMERFGLPDPADHSEFFSSLQEIVSDFHRWAFEKEKALLREVGGGDSIVSSLSTSLKTKHMMRLGFGVGTLYQTLIGVVEDEDPDLAAKAINNLKLGKFPRKSVGLEIYPPYPKTIELTSDPKPLGWVEWNFTD